MSTAPRLSLTIHDENIERIEEEQHQARLKSSRFSVISQPALLDNNQVIEIIDSLSARNGAILKLSAGLLTKIYESNLLKKIVEETQKNFDEKTTLFYASGALKINSFTHLKQIEPFKTYFKKWIERNTEAINIMRVCIHLENAISQSSFLIARTQTLSVYKELAKHLRANESTKIKKIIQTEEGETRQISLVNTTATHAENIASVLDLLDKIDFYIEKKSEQLKEKKKTESSQPKEKADTKIEVKKEHARQRSRSQPACFFSKAGKADEPKAPALKPGVITGTENHWKKI